MSWRATAWAKETTGHKSIAEKFLLMVLSDYASPDDNQCWPSQAKLASLCMMTERGVRNCLDRLEANGFVTRLKKGNQHQPSLYRVNVGHSAAPSCEPEICAIESAKSDFNRSGSYSCEPEPSEPEMSSHSKVNRNSEDSEPELSDSEPEMRSSEPELWVGANRHLEPSLRTVNKRGGANAPTRAQRFTEIDSAFRERMRSEFGALLPDVDEAIDNAIGHTSYRKWDDKRRFVRQWLKGDAQQPGRSPPGPDTASQRRPPVEIDYPEL